MTFYIAERNKETGKFELWMSEDKPLGIFSESEAIGYCEDVIKSYGDKNVILLEEVLVNVDVKVTIYVPGDKQ